MMKLTKLIQKKTYDVLSTRHGLLGVILGIIFLLSSAFYFGEAISEWSSEKYAVLFNSFSDNLLQKSFRTRLCLPVPIDVVYTWVNGTDPNLLSGLRKAKAALEVDLNNGSVKVSSSLGCSYANCIKAPIVIFSPPLSVNLSRLIDVEPEYGAAYKLETTGSDDSLSNFTVVLFHVLTDVSKVWNKSVTIDSVERTPYRTFFTSDVTIPHSKLQSNLVLVSGFKRDYRNEEVMNLLPQHIKLLVLEIQMEGRVALFKTPTSSDAAALIQSQHNFTVDGRYLQYDQANLIYDLTFNQKDSALVASRFADNEELRYSLRSLEQYAPWVHHIYLVTNGQLPYWLSLDNPKLTIVAHEEIFPNKSHLPTFSSPAIESHLHRIPELSEKFIYMNDDVMLGAQVWPDDFFTHSKGQKVYLAWSIPDCSPGCPNSWIKDGYCDKACNVSACGWDAGDCAGGVPSFQAGQWNHGWDQYPRDDMTNCNMGCSNNWIADKYCDQACNVKACGFDAGDCGVSDFNKLYRVDVRLGKSNYRLPNGISVAYFNLTSVFREKVSSASYEENDVIRAATICNKYKVLTLVMKENYNQTNVNMDIKFGESADSEVFHITVSVDTRRSTAVSLVYNETNQSVNAINSKAIKTVAPTTAFIFEDIPEEQRAPRSPDQQEFDLTSDQVHGVVNESILHLDIQNKLKELRNALTNGELTQKGFDTKRLLLLRNSQMQFKPNVKNNRNKIKRGRKLLDVAEEGFLPWEKSDDIIRLVKVVDQRQRLESFETKFLKRKLLDSYAQSLHHVNDLYNKMFGVKARKVPGHIPHMIDKQVIMDCQATFPTQWDLTSSHKIRQGTDMQYAFSYNYFLMDSKRNNTEFDFLEEMDIDNSGVLSDRELRTLATRIYDSPLDLESLTSLENHIINCSEHLSADEQSLKSPPLADEVYYDKRMPQATLPLLQRCDPILSLIKHKVSHKPKYKFEIMGDEDTSFKMIGTNVSTVVGQLDDIRRHPKKFVCLNDNIDHSRPESSQVKALLADFYESLFPIPSQFELPRDYRNRFLNIDELREWRKYRDTLKLIIEVVLILLVIYTVYSYYTEQTEQRTPTGSSRPHLLPTTMLNTQDFPADEINNV